MLPLCHRGPPHLQEPSDEHVLPKREPSINRVPRLQLLYEKVWKSTDMDEQALTHMDIGTVVGMKMDGE